MRTLWGIKCAIIRGVGEWSHGATVKITLNGAFPAELHSLAAVVFHKAFS